MIHVKSLGETQPDVLYEAFNNAFSDYDRTWSKYEFEKMLQRRGYVAGLSFGAFDEERLVSFILNCTGMFNGKPTVYDAGTGTIKEYRRQGLTKQIFKESIPYFRQAQMQQYLLEVLQHNEPAVSIYKSLGFNVHRSLHYFMQDKEQIIACPKLIPAGIVLKPTDISAINQLDSSWDFVPSWQNSNDSVAGADSDLIIMGAFENNRLCGYGIIEPSSGDIPQIAVDRQYRRKYIGSAILAELLKYNRSNVVKVINTDASYYIITDFLRYHNISQSGAQYEMILELV